MEGYSYPEPVAPVSGPPASLPPTLPTPQDIGGVNCNGRRGGERGRVGGVGWGGAGSGQDG